LSDSAGESQAAVPADVPTALSVLETGTSAERATANWRRCRPAWPRYNRQKAAHWAADGQSRRRVRHPRRPEQSSGCRHRRCSFSCARTALPIRSARPTMWMAACWERS